MRLFLNCLLLVSVAVALPNGRQKRDLFKFQNWITSAIFGQQQINVQPSPILGRETGYKLYRQPGYDNVLIKVSQKTPFVKEFMFPEVKPVNLNAFGSIVGTKSHKNTLVAVKKVNKLLSSGILSGQHNHLMKETIVPMFPKLNTVNPIPVIETRRPVLTKIIKPYEEKVELEVPFEPKYSYQQSQRIEPVMTHITNNKPDVKVVETIKKESALPLCGEKRIDDVIMLDAKPYRRAPEQRVYQFQPVPVVDIAYPRVEANSYIQNQQKYGGMLTETFETVPEFGLTIQPFKDGPVRYNVRPMKSQAINYHPLSLHLFTSPHLDTGSDIRVSKTNDNWQTSIVNTFDNVGDKVKISQTLGPIPSQYIAYTSNKELPALSKEKTTVRTNIATIMSTKDNISNEKIPSYVYEHQYNPNTGKVVKGNDALKTNVETNTNYYAVQPVINSEAPIMENKGKEDGLHTNKVTAILESVTDIVISSSTNKPKQNSVTASPQSVKDNPIVEADIKNYSSQQKNADGSSRNVKGDNHGVSVDVKESNAKGRGDIPDQ